MQLLLLTICGTPAGIEDRFQMDEGQTDRRRMEGQTDVEVEIVI